MCQKTPYLNFFYLKYKEDLRSRLTSPPSKETLSASLEHQFSDLIIMELEGNNKDQQQHGEAYIFFGGKINEEKSQNNITKTWENKMWE